MTGYDAAIWGSFRDWGKIWRHQDAERQRAEAAVWLQHERDNGQIAILPIAYMVLADILGVLPVALVIAH